MTWADLSGPDHAVVSIGGGTSAMTNPADRRIRTLSMSSSLLSAMGSRDVAIFASKCIGMSGTGWLEASHSLLARRVTGRWLRSLRKTFCLFQHLGALGQCLTGGCIGVQRGSKLGLFCRRTDLRDDPYEIAVLDAIDAQPEQRWIYCCC